MGRIHQINDEYYIEFYARGLLYQQKAGKDLKAAQELLRSVEEKIANGETLTIARDIELDVFFDDFFKMAQRQYHPATVRRLRSTADHFLGFIHSQFPDLTVLSKMTPRVIEEYKVYGIKRRQSKVGKVNPKVINLTLLLLREILEHGIKTGYINDNPTLHIRLLEMGSSGPDVLSDAQLTMMLEHLHESYRDMFVFMSLTGLRPTELLDLTWDQIDLNRQVLFVRLREVPLMGQAKNILQKLFVSVIDHKAQVFLGPGGEVVNAAILYEAFENVRQLCELPPHISLASFRHIFIAELLRKRVSFLTISKLLGIPDPAKLMLFTGHIPLGHKDALIGD